MHTFNLHIELPGFKACFCAIALGASCRSRLLFRAAKNSPQDKGNERAASVTAAGLYDVRQRQEFNGGNLAAACSLCQNQERRRSKRAGRV
jgi:hypothetical protein